MATEGRREPAEDGPTAIIMLDGQPYYVGYRVAKIARFLVENAREINREDLDTLEFRCNQQSQGPVVDPYWHFRGRRLK